MKRVSPIMKAHLIRGAFYLLLAFALCVIPLALGQRTERPSQEPRSNEPKPAQPAVCNLGGSAGGQTTATARVFRYNPITDTIDAIAAPWPGNSDEITLPGGFAVYNNKLYILGGFRINTAMTNQIWEFTPTTNVWVLKNAVLPVARGFIPAAANTFSPSGIYAV